MQLRAEATFAPDAFATAASGLLLVRSEPVRAESSFVVAGVVVQEDVEAVYAGPESDAVQRVAVPDAADLLLVEGPRVTALPNVQAGERVSVGFAIKPSVLDRLTAPDGSGAAPRCITVRICLTLEPKEDAP